MVTQIVAARAGSRVTGVLKIWMTEADAATADDAGIARMIETASDEGYVAACAALAMVDNRACARDIQRSTVVAVGSQDHAAPAAASEAVVPAIVTLSRGIIAGAIVTCIAVPAFRLNEVLILCLGVAIASCIPSGCARAVHLTLDLLVTRLQRAAARAFALMGSLLLMLFLLLVGKQLMDLAITYAPRNQTTIILHWQIAPFYYAMAGLVLHVIDATMTLLREGRGLSRLVEVLPSPADTGPRRYWASPGWSGPMPCPCFRAMTPCAV